MAQPRKVKEGAALAETLIARAAEGNIAPANPPAPAVAPQLAVVSDALPAAPTVGELPAVNPYDVGPPMGAPVPNAPVPAVAPSSDGWDHKYNVLKGMFDNQRAKDADTIQQLENQVGALTRMAATAPTTIQDTFHPDVLPQPSDYGMTEEEVDALGGPDFVEAIRKISASGLAPTIEALTNEVNGLRKDQTESAEDTFYARLHTLSPGWEAINKDDRFEAWLMEGEGLSGIPRRNFLTNAYDDRDAETAARYFNNFAALLPSPPEHDPAVLGDIIPVNAGGGAPLQPANQGTIYSPKSIQQFFKDKGLGKFKGREDVALAIEKDIFAAQKEGRIRVPAPT